MIKFTKSVLSYIGATYPAIGDAHQIALTLNWKNPSNTLNRLVDFHAKSFKNGKRSEWQQSGALIMAGLKIGALPTNTPKNLSAWSSLPIHAFYQLQKNKWDGLWPESSIRHMSSVYALAPPLWNAGSIHSIRLTEHQDFIFFQDFLLSDAFPKASWHNQDINQVSALTSTLIQCLAFARNPRTDSNPNDPFQISKRVAASRIFSFPERLLKYVNTQSDFQIILNIADEARKFGELPEVSEAAIIQKSSEILKINNTGSTFTQKNIHAL